MKYYSSITILLILSLAAGAQTPVSKENFTLSWETRNFGGQFRYNGIAHSFLIDVEADQIRQTGNPNYIIADEHIIQTSIIPIPQGNLDLNRLSPAQQKNILNGYINYELDYFRNQLKIEYANLKKDWQTVDNRLWVIWTFDVPMARKKTPDSLAATVKSQVYASTICFNQVLDLNIPVMEGEDQPLSLQMINRLMAKLRVFDTHF